MITTSAYEEMRRIQHDLQIQRAVNGASKRRSRDTISDSSRRHRIRHGEDLFLGVCLVWLMSEPQDIRVAFARVGFAIPGIRVVYWPVSVAPAYDTTTPRR